MGVSPRFKSPTFPLCEMGTKGSFGITGGYFELVQRFPDLFAADVHNAILEKLRNL